MSDSVDSFLADAAIDGDRAAFAELIGRYRAAVWGTVYRILGNSEEGEDAVQEVFLRALASLSKYDRRYPFGPWILRIASNYCIDQLRRRKVRKYRLWSDFSEVEEGKILRGMAARPSPETLSPEEVGRYLEIAQALLNRLNPKRRVAFVLREIEGHSYEQVASILKIPEATARVRVWRARRPSQRVPQIFVGFGKKDKRWEGCVTCSITTGMVPWIPSSESSLSLT